MSNKNCTNCKHSEWLRHDSGKRKLEYAGECNYQVKIPFAFKDMRGDMPHRNDISKWTCRDKICPCWGKII